MSAKNGYDGDKGVGGTFILGDLRKRFQGLPAPKGLFDPRTAAPDLLELYGIPLRPDPSSLPLETAAWDATFGEPLVIEKFEFDAIVIENIIKSPFRLFARHQSAQPVSETRFETSPNWSGAYITANQFKTFQRLWGRWRTPATLTIPPAPLEGAPGVDFGCSNWIGLDGQRRYFDASLPQVGTASYMKPDGSGLKTDAWIQWWARDAENPLPIVLSLAVSPGDKIAAHLRVKDPANVVGWIVNRTTHKGTPVSATAPTAGPTGPQHRIAGATAEWIMERPAIPNQTTRFNFPDYGHSKFRHCVAVEADPTDPDSPLGWRERTVLTSRRIRMFDTLEAPEQLRLISIPEEVTRTKIRLRYGGL